MTQQTKPVLEAISKVMADTGSVQKRGKNEFHHYSYATASDIAAVLQKTMATHGLIIIQHEKERQFTHNDSVLMVSYEFTLAHTSGDIWGEKIVQTGMCSAKNTKGGIDDKAVNKCHTAARKYFVLGLFFIPTGDYADSDSGPDSPPPEPQREEPPVEVDYMAKLLRLMPNVETKTMARDYLRDQKTKAGNTWLKPDGELSDLEPEQVKYLLENWSTFLVKVDAWHNQIPGAEVSDGSSWRDCVIHFSTKNFPTIKGMTLGQAFDNKETHKWAIGTLLGYEATGYNGNPPSEDDLALEAACKKWRIENGKETT